MQCGSSEDRCMYQVNEVLRHVTIDRLEGINVCFVN